MSIFVSELTDAKQVISSHDVVIQKENLHLFPTSIRYFFFFSRSHHLYIVKNKRER